MFSAFQKFGRLGASASAAPFSPTKLFAAGEQGAWLDFSDFGAMFQDSAGTTPVTSVGQQVGKIIDKSGRGNHVTQSDSSKRPYLYGSPSGENLCADANFITGVGWTAGAGWSLSPPHASAVTAAGTLSYSFSPTVGSTYWISIGFGDRAAGSVSATFGGKTLGARTDTNGSLFAIVKATTEDPLVIVSTGFTGKILSVGVFDISSPSVCKAPYFLYFDGVDDCLSGTNTIAAYPFTLSMAGTVFVPSTIPSAVCLYNGDSDFKAVDGGNARGLDWKEGVLSSYSGFGSLFENTIVSVFSSSSNVSENQFIAGSSAVNTNTFGVKPTMYIGRSRAAFPMYGTIRGVIALDREMTASEKNLVQEYFSGGDAICGWGDSMTAASAGATAGDGSWLMRLRTLTNRWTANKGAGGENSSQIKARFLANGSAEKKWVNVFWMGTNDNFIDYATWKSTIFANVDECISGLGGKKRFIVLGITQAEGVDRPLNELNADMAIKYGNHFLDIRKYLEDRNDGSANDLADIAANLVPRSLRADTIHLNDLGNHYVSTAISEKLRALQWT